MIYRVEQKVHTLAENAVNVTKHNPHFSLLGVKFTQWEFNHADGWLGDAWLAEATINAESYSEAYQKFRRKMVKVIPRLSFVSQCYSNFGYEPFLVIRDDLNIAYFYDIFDSGHTGLMFQAEEESALKQLVKDKTIPDEFFLYWNDAVVTVGYSSKLLVMFAALEALAKKPSGKVDYKLIEKILGKKLKTFAYKPRVGLRHRLSHGEHFSRRDFKENYVESIHKAVVRYFNREVFGKQLISEDTVGPQRHFLDNRSLGRYFIKPTKGEELKLKNVVKAFGDHKDRNPTEFDYVFDESITKNF